MDCKDIVKSRTLRVTTGLIVLSDTEHNQRPGYWWGDPYGGCGFFRYQLADMPAHGPNPAGVCLASVETIKELPWPRV